MSDNERVAPDDVTTETGPGENGPDDRESGVSSTEEAADDAPTSDTVGAEEPAQHDIGDLRAELDSVTDRHLRLAAEFTNYRRRAETELAEAWARGQADLLRHFLDGLDDLQRVGTWQPDSTTVEALVEGVDLVERKFRQAMELAGVEVFEPRGEVFDPNTMEAMVMVPTDSPEEDGNVQDVFQKGYVFKGHLVRPARVTVFKHE